MKEKIQIVVLIVIFVIILISIKIFINYEGKVNIKTSNNMAIDEYQYVDNNSIVEEDNMENNVLEVTSKNFEAEVLKSNKIVLVDFYADWCGPCQILSPIVEEVAKVNNNVKVVRINVDESQELAIEYGVMSIPTLVIIKNGKEINRSVGVISQSQIEELIEEI